MNIIVYPSDSGRNPYISIHKNVWSNLGYKVLGVKEFYRVMLKRRENIFVVNWLEDKVVDNKVSSLMAFILSLAIFLLFRIICHRVIYVRHNYRPHQADTRETIILYNILVSILHRLSDKRVNHLKNFDDKSGRRYEYLPHPLYVKRVNFLEDEKRDIEYLMFGEIQRYKGVSELLDVWPSQKKLYIIGRANSKDLQLEIEAKIRDRNLSVVWRNEFVSDDELERTLLKTKFVILSHLDDSMIVSGSFFYAISFGANVIGLDNEFLRCQSHRFPFVNYVNGESVFEEIDGIQYVSSKVVFESADLFFGLDVISSYWKHIVES